MRKPSVIILPLLIAMLLVSCGSSVNGTYKAVSTDSWPKEISFGDGKANIDGIGYPYEEKGGKIWVTDPEKGSVPFEILPNGNIKSEIFGEYSKKNNK